jgi:hypothetical protein
MVIARHSNQYTESEMRSLNYCRLSLDVTTVADISTTQPPAHTSSPTWNGAKQSFHIGIDTTAPTNHPLHCSSGHTGKNFCDLYQTDAAAYSSPSEAGSLQAPNYATNGQPTTTPNTTKSSADIKMNTINMTYSIHEALTAQRHNGSPPATHLFPSVYKKQATTVGSSHQHHITTYYQNPPKGTTPPSKHTFSPFPNGNETYLHTSSYTHHQSI